MSTPPGTRTRAPTRLSSSSGYRDNFTGATTTTLFGIDSDKDILVRQGGVSVPPGTPSPNTGQLFTIGALGQNTDSNVGFDLVPLTGIAYASLTVSGTSGLYTVNLSTGAATLVGTIGDGTLDVRGLALPVVTPTLYALTNTGQILTVKATTPNTSTGSITITGLQGGESLVGIDIRPATGILYGIGSTGRLYVINQVTGTATQIGAQFTLTGTWFGVSFDPLADRLRVVSDQEQNLRINPDDGSVVVDPPIPGSPTPGVVGAAYLNPFTGAGSTELLGIDANFDTLVKLTPSPPAIASIGPLGASTSGFVGFDIAPDGNLALASLNVGAGYQLYVINTTTGAATLIGAFGQAVYGIAIAPVGRFGIAGGEVPETAGTATITATRTAGTVGPASVDFAATSGSAAAGSDFTAVSGTLFFADGDTTETFSVPVLDDTAFEGDETVNLALSNPLQGASLSTATATLTIKSDDPDPGPGGGGGRGGDGDGGGNTPPPGSDAAPALTGLDMTNRRFAARGTPRPPGVPRGTRFLFNLSENADVKIAIDRIKPGRRVNGRCVRPTRRNRDRPRCKRFIRKGSISDQGEAGANRLRFSGRLRGKALAPGRYRGDGAGDRLGQPEVGAEADPLPDRQGLIGSFRLEPTGLTSASGPVRMFAVPAAPGTAQTVFELCTISPMRWPGWNVKSCGRKFTRALTHSPAAGSAVSRPLR